LYPLLYILNLFMIHMQLSSNDESLHDTKMRNAFASPINIPKTSKKGRQAHEYDWK
jgi:hypothetical protein